MFLPFRGNALFVVKRHGNLLFLVKKKAFPEKRSLRAHAEKGGGNGNLPNSLKTRELSNKACTIASRFFPFPGATDSTVFSAKQTNFRKMPFHADKTLRSSRLKEQQLVGSGVFGCRVFRRAFANSTEKFSFVYLKFRNKA